MASLRTLFKKLTEQWKSTNKNLDAISMTIAEMKVEFMSVPFLPTDEEDKKENAEIMQMQRDVLEIACLVSVLQQDIPGFERGITQLKHYYCEVEPDTGTKFGESPLKYQMLGLDLLSLLAQNKLPEFHMELERIPPQAATKNPYIDAPVRMEQYLMEGAYNKIFLERNNMPSQYYDFFVDILLDTVRDEIGNCMERAYQSLGIQESARMLFFDGPDANRKALSYGQKRRWTVTLDEKSFVFSRGAGKPHLEDSQFVDAKKLAEQNIFYAKQLEMIV